MKKFAATALALTVTLAGAAKADEIALAAPLAGATLHAENVDMSVVWTEIAGQNAFEVTAIYVGKDNADAPSRMVMALEDGDRVSFSLPGETKSYYTFSRDGGVVTATAARAPREIASR